MKHSKIWLHLVGSLFIMLTSLGRSLSASAQELTPIPEHAGITAYEGPGTCLACHAESGKEVAESLHYQHQGPAPYLQDAVEGINYGMMDTY